MGAVTIRRMSERLPAPAGPTVPILQAAFGMRPEVPGPVWLLEPSAELRAAFWHRFGERISEATAPSWASPPARRREEPAFDEFLYQLAGAFGGVYPDGRALPATLPAPAMVSVAEAFSFAAEQDRRPETPWLDDPFGIATTTHL